MSKPIAAGVTLIFVIPCALAGLWCTWKILDNVATSMEADSWVAIPADVTAADLKELRRANSNTVTYQANGAYRYQYNGKSYDSTRLAIDMVQGSDNIGTWHQDTAARLKGAMAARKPITVWVNPADPAQAVADKSLRLGMVLFMLPFAVAFISAAFVAGWFARLAWKLS